MDSVIIKEFKNYPTYEMLKEKYLDQKDQDPYDVVPWPEELSKEAFHGLAGEIVEEIRPFSEADDSALLLNLLTAFGNVIGPNAHFRAGADRHGLNLFVTLVGDSSKGRKGMSWGWIKEILKNVDPEWTKYRIPSGLASGEGLIWYVRDMKKELSPAKGESEDYGYKEVIIDQGVSDKRLLVMESEFASVLKVTNRQGNTLSPVIRQAWDGEVLQSLTKNNSAMATGAHISIIGHITKTELLKLLSENDQVNGFANRFLWMCVRRSKYLPDGGRLSENQLEGLSKKIREAVDFAQNTSELTRDDYANMIWHQVYPELSEGQAGNYGVLLGRAEAQVMRLACLYALLDLKATIKACHMKAALALWRRCEDSVKFIFNYSENTSTEEQILEALTEGDLSQSEVNNLFNGHLSSGKLSSILQKLSAQGKVKQYKVPTSSRPKTMWSIRK